MSIATVTVTAATPQYRSLIQWYSNFLPKSTFPWMPLTIAAVFQVIAWFGGRFLGPFTAIPRVMILWVFALGEYLFMSPAMTASVEVLGMKEPLLVVIYQVVTLAVFMVMNTMVFKNPFQFKYLVAFTLLAAAVYVAYMW